MVQQQVNTTLDSPARRRVFGGPISSQEQLEADVRKSWDGAIARRAHQEKAACISLNQRAGIWCWRGELNPHAAFAAPDFESGASASSATPARSKAGTIISLETRLSVTQTAMGQYELMRASGLKQKDLVDIFGTPSIVSEVLKGKRNLTVEHIRRLSQRFHVTPELFI